ncbi:MAG: NIPSNAP family protein [Pseudomonadales bacterium]|nr:NIPSNAP family protein [Pseudomonadales bacterium]NRA17772.1 NIPSNAP family protein [Oceanospirillaceae bacterium]
MITCYIEYVIDPYKVDQFEAYAKLWIPLVNSLGGTHHGYFLPHEGANNIAYALFSFASLSAYEAYRQQLSEDKQCLQAFAYAEKNRCIISYRRSFMRPLLAQESASQ